MSFKLDIGLKKQIETFVRKEDTAIQYGSGTVEVFATPAMIALMEKASCLCVQEKLPVPYTSVGFEVNVKHLKASPLGMKVRCESKLVAIKGKKLSFEVEVYDEFSKIGTGTHTRYIVDKEEFESKL